MPGQSGIVIKIPNDNPSKAFISKGFQKFKNKNVPTFIDSGASDTMFVSRNVLMEYKPVMTCVGDSAKAENGNFEIIREVSVVQQYQVEGKEWKITCVHALHMPTLNNNLVSVSALDNAGLTIMFRGGKGVVKKEDGTIILMRSLHSPTYSGRIPAGILDSNRNFQNPVGTFLAVIVSRQNISG